MNYLDEIFNREYKNAIDFIENYLKIKLETLEKSVVKEQVRYVFGYCLNRKKFDLDNPPEKLGSFMNIRLEEEVLLMYLRNLGISSNDFWLNNNKDWFKQEVLRRREEYLLL